MLLSPANAERLSMARNRAQEQTLPLSDLDELAAKLQPSHKWMKQRSVLLRNDTNGSFAQLFEAVDRSEPSKVHDWS